MKSIILARVSTEEQKEAGNSLPAQINRLKEYCKRKNFKIIKTFSFDESAYKTNRDEFDKVLDYLKSNKEKIAICFDKVDRLSRNVFDKRVSMLYEKAVADEIEIHFVSDGQTINSKMSAVEKFQFGMSLGLAKYYSDAISDNVKRAIEQKLRKGECIGKAHLGYKNITLEDGSKDVILDKDRNFFIKKAFELYATGNYSMKKLAKEMNRRGLRNYPSEKPLTTSQIEQMLKNHFYYGLMIIKRKSYPHKYEPIISKYLFDKVQSVMASYNRQNFKRTNKPYVFRGLVQCHECGCSISPEIKKGKYVYYHCTNYHGNCNNVVWIREEDLLEQVKTVFTSLKLDQEALEVLKQGLRNTHESEKAYYEKNTKKIKDRINQIQSRLKIMYEDRLDGRITTNEYDKMLAEYKNEEQDLIMQLEEHSQADENFYITANKVLSLSQRAYELFQSSEPQEKTQLLGFILQNFSLKGKKLLFELKMPFNGIVEYAKTGNWLRVADDVRTCFIQKIQSLYIPVF